jgi:chitin synthase
MNEEDRKKYALAQAGQRAAGGAYMTGPPTGQVYELTEAEMMKNGWRDSVESVVSQQSTHQHSRGSSKNSNGGDITPPDTADGNNLLSVPHASSNGHARRSGRSPLARMSLIRTPSNAGDDIELNGTRQSSRSPSRNVI